MRRNPRWSFPLLSALLLSALLLAGAPAPAAQVEPEARRIAESVLEAMGGRDAWDGTRCLSWKFFGGRVHYWEKSSGDIRIEIPEDQDRQGQRTPAKLILMNLNTRQGRAWLDGVEVSGDQLAEELESGWRVWVNDSYWAFMPYKLLDPGVNLRYVGEQLMADDRSADVLEVTFEQVGVTPQNRYLVHVAKDSGLVEQWSYFPTRDAAEPGFTLPWAGWQRFGEIMIATDHGRGRNWDFRVYDEVPEGLFTDPAVSGR